MIIERKANMMVRFLAILALAITLPAARGHFTMLLPSTPSGKKGEEVSLVYQFGHPYEQQLFDASPPARLVVLNPDGKSRDITKSLEKIKVKGALGKQVAAYRLRFTPDQRGDYTFILNTPPIWMAEDKEFLQDTAKVILHVQAQKGWDAAPGKDFKIVPLTRPYGLLAGMVVQARITGGAQPFAEKSDDPSKLIIGMRDIPLAGLPVFVERFNPAPPKKLPPDELITFASKTDPNGIITTTLPSAGWWSITAQRDAGQRNYNGKDYPLRQRATLWVYVNERE
jgi:cobalt/nickel transport protein